MTAPDWTEFTARRPFLTPRARRGTMEPATRLRKSPIPAILAVVGGGIRRMSVNSKLRNSRWPERRPGGEQGDEFATASLSP